MIVNALFLALMVVSPLIWFRLAAPAGTYQGINIASFGIDEKLNLTRGKEVLQGHHLGNVVLREGKDGEESQFTYVEYWLLTPLRWLGAAQAIDVVTIYHVYNFIGVFALALLIYSLALQLSGDKRFSILSALFVIGGYTMIYNRTVASAEFNIYGRAISPYVHSVAFFVFLNLLVKSIKTATRWSAVYVGLGFGLLFYDYFFCWTFALALLGSLGLVALVIKDWGTVKRMTSITAIGIAVGAYNIAQMILFFQSGAGTQLSYFIWLGHTHLPIFSKIGAVTLLVLAAYLCKNRQDPNRLFFLGLVLSGWVALNQQVITGRLMQPAHYYWYFIVPSSIITCLYVVWSAVKNNRHRQWLAIALAILIYGNAFIGQYRATFLTLAMKLEEQWYRPLIDVLNRDRTPGVILTAEEPDASYLFTIYTPHDVFWNGSAALLQEISLQRIKDVLYVYSFLDKNARSNFVGRILYALKTPAKRWFYEDTYQSIEGLASGYDWFDYLARSARDDAGVLETRQRVLADLYPAYQAVTRDTPSVLAMLKRYGINYIVWDRNNHPEWDLSFLTPHLQELASSHNIILYKLD